MSDMQAMPNPERLMQPLPNPKAFLKVSGPLFDAHECTRIRESIDPTAWSQELVDNPVQTLIGNTANERRISAQSVRLDTQTGWPLSQVVLAATEANRTVYQYRLTGLVPSDPPQIVRLTADDDGDPRFKLAANATRPTRKLGFLVQLSPEAEYTGGEFEFEFGSDWDPVAIRPQGTMLLYPCFQGHRTARVTAGERWFLAGFIHGPSFS